MRLGTVRIIGLFALLLTGCAPVPVDRRADAPPAPPPPPRVENTGCLGKEVHACIDMLKSQMRGRDTAAGDIDEQVQTQLTANNAVDVNGRSLGRSRTLDLHMEMEPYARRHVVIDYDRANLVTAIQIELPGDPIGSRTTHDYDGTGLLPALRIICGTPCGDVSAAELYKFFENQVKPHLHVARNERQRLHLRGYGGRSSVEYLAWSDPVGFHGMHFQYAYLAPGIVASQYPAIILSK